MRKRKSKKSMELNELSFFKLQSRKDKMSNFTTLQDEKKKGNIAYVFDNGKTTVYAEKGADREELYQKFVVRSTKVI